MPNKLFKTGIAVFIFTTRVVAMSGVMSITTNIASAQETTPPTTAAVESAAKIEAKIETNIEPKIEVKPKPAVYSRRIKAPLSKIYKRLFNALENNGYFVVFEVNIGKNLAHYAQRWGKDYNINKLDAIRSMVFCNAGYANEVSNADPRLMALCPLHVTLIQQKGITSILFIRPGKVAQGSAAHDVAVELEQDVVRIIDEVSG